MKRIKSSMNRKKVLGFSLVEVLVGVAIAAVGVVGVLELQKKFITSGNEVNARAIAMQLIREKFDEIKAIDDFAEISASTSTITKSNYSFARSAATTNYYYDSGAGSWSNSSSSSNRLSGKSVDVTVTWTDINGESQSISQTEVFSKVSLHDSSTASNTIGEKTSPKVPFASYQSVENPPIELIDDSFVYEGVGNSKETSKPIPTVYARDDNNLIQFETAVYDPDSDTQTLEDFATINCKCTYSGQGEGATPTMYRISDDGASLVNDESSGLMVTKTTGVPNGDSQPEICTTCCRDHHDDSGVDAKYSPAEFSDNHNHYNAGLDAAPSGGNYIEACRLRRVDGFYKVVPDWQLIDVVVMPISYFNEPDNVAEYISYVKLIVKRHVLNNSPELTDEEAAAEKISLLPNRDLTTSPTTQQLIARGIYVDTASLNAEDLATITGYVSTKANWLEYVPFYEINLSLFGDWNSANTDAVTVTNDAISTVVNVDQNYYGTYSRGRITANSVDNLFSEVSVSIRTDNTGITGSGAITPDTPSLEDSILVTVDNDAEGEITHNITIEIGCFSYNNRDNLDGCSNADTEDLTFTIIGIPLDCVYSPKRGSSTAFLSCDNVPNNWSGTITLSKTGYTFKQNNVEGDSFIISTLNDNYNPTEHDGIVVTMTEN